MAAAPSNREPSAVPCGLGEVVGPLSADRRTALYRATRPAVFDLLVRRIGNVEEAEALSQDVLLRAFDAAEQRPIRNFAAYCLRSASHLAIDTLRRRRFEQATGELEAEAPSLGPDTVELPRLRTAVDGLPADQRILLELRYVDGFSFAEIAERLRMSKNGVFARHERALESLRRTFRRPRSV